MAMTNSSIKKLATCHPDIVTLIEALAQDEDLIVIEGARTLERQKELMATGKSTVKEASNGKHVVTEEKPLSDAIDVAPYPKAWREKKQIDWKDTKAFYAFGERLVKKAKELLDAGLIGSKIRWGGDWDGDGDYTDQKFHDLVHFERVT